MLSAASGSHRASLTSKPHRPAQGGTALTSHVLAFLRDNAQALTALGVVAGAMTFAANLGMQHADLQKQLQAERELRASELSKERELRASELSKRDGELAKERELRASEVARAKLEVELASRAAKSRWW